MTAPPDKPGFVVIGRVSGAWGVQGWIKLQSYTEQPEDIFRYQPWILRRGGRSREVRVVQGKRHSTGLVARLQDVDDRDQARQWVGHDILVARDQLPVLPQGEYYWEQLTGLEAVTRDGTALGRVVSLLETGANDVLVVQGERERLIPFTPQVVLGVDLQAGCIRLDWDPDF